MKVDRFPMSKCLNCGRKLDAATATSEDDQPPHPGAVTLCIWGALTSCFVRMTWGYGIHQLGEQLLRCAAMPLAPTAESSLPQLKIFFQKRPPSERLPPFCGRNRFWTGFWERGHKQFSESKSPPYRGADTHRACHLPAPKQTRYSCTGAKRSEKPECDGRIAKRDRAALPGAGWSRTLRFLAEQVCTQKPCRRCR
jgi:hypothetical protein